jgi:hypothetical protein
MAAALLTCSTFSAMAMCCSPAAAYRSDELKIEMAARGA